MGNCESQSHGRGLSKVARVRPTEERTQVGVLDVGSDRVDSKCASVTDGRVMVSSPPSVRARESSQGSFLTHF